VRHSGHGECHELSNFARFAPFAIMGALILTLIVVGTYLAQL
jgi:hypothetical protein